MKRESDYISVVMFQLHLDLASNSKEEYLLSTEDYVNQMNNSIGIVYKLKPDIVVFPEMSYSKDFEETMREISATTLVVYGSTYMDGKNTTIVFQGGNKREVIKKYPSGAEPMARKYRNLSPIDFMQDYQEEHTFIVKGEKIVVLNCLEYYRVAYFIARDPASKDIFGLVVPCSNSNSRVFLEESMALHNHNVNIYSFVCNTVSTYNGKTYGDGTSYIFGPIHKYEKEWLQKEGIHSCDHFSSIARLDKSSSYIYGEFAIPRQNSWFARSDFYVSNPQNMTVNQI